MLARNNLGVEVPPLVEREICSWVADGVKVMVGFLGSGTCSGEYRLYVGNDPDPWYVMQTSPAERSIQVADRGTRLPQSTVVSLRVIHEAPGTQVFKGTILGG